MSLLNVVEGVWFVIFCSSIFCVLIVDLCLVLHAVLALSLSRYMLDTCIPICYANASLPQYLQNTKDTAFTIDLAISSPPLVVSLAVLECSL